MLVKGWSLVASLSFVAVIAAGCGDDREFKDGAGATGGTAGSSGQAGKGGGGSGGRAGNGGLTSGGTGNTGTGAAGAGGSPELDGGESGVGGSTSGRAGSDAGGETGTEGGAGGAPPDGREPCATEDEGELRCAGNAQRERLRCNGEVWEEYEECESTERCDTRSGSDAACAPVVDGCEDKEPGEGACVGLEHFDCGPDLVTVENSGSCDIFCVEQDGTATCSACEDGQYSPDGSPESCTDWSTCEEGQYVSSPATGTTDRVCRDCDDGSFSDALNALSCTEWKTCDAGTYVTGQGDTTSDRTCGACASGTYSATENAVSCTAWSSCAAGTFVSDQGSAEQNRECSACASGSYSTTQNATSCTSWANCAAGTFVSNTPSATTNRTCSACASGNFSASQNSSSCSPWTTCTWAMGGTATAGTASSNAICGTASPYRQVGTANADMGSSVAVDGSGNVFLVGDVGADFIEANPTGDAGFIRKYDLNGNTVWTRQITAPAAGAIAFGVATDANGNSYVTGYTIGVLDGTNAGGIDAFVRKYDSAGNVTWTRQFGTSGSEWGYSVAVDSSGNVYVSGATSSAFPSNTNAGNNDSFVRKLNSSGTAQWTRQWGTTSADRATGIRVNGSGSVYVISDIGGDGELRTLSPSTGADVWASPGTIVTTGAEDARGVAVSSNGESVVTGYTGSGLAGTSAGGPDVYVRKYNATGGVVWTRQFGTSASEYGTAVVIDGSGNVYVSGYTNGALTGTNAGGSDAFIRKYNSSGTVLWTQQFGGPNNDETDGLAADGSENLYIAGSTFGALAPVGFGSWDAYVRQIVP